MIKIYNTLNGKLEEFKPVKENEVSIYVCGPTVYNFIHVGNARPIMIFDTVRRYLEYKGYKVKFVQNFTDIDDKMINKAIEEGTTVKEIADKFIRYYYEDTSKLNIKEEGTLHPKATEHIKEMIKLVKTLEEKGYAYESDGDVYFEVNKYEKYGKLSHQKVEDLISGARIEQNNKKKNALDFTLWKKAKEGEPKWGSPWGEGRPGWHLECSVMSLKEFGGTFDIHGGGQDLIFPHHENEIAQSECATGNSFANYWMHNGYINIKGEKMSKSKGNFFLLRDILEKYSGSILRLFMISSHYRKPIEFSEDELIMAKTGLERIENFMKRIKEMIDIEKLEKIETFTEIVERTKEKFEKAMNDDFNTSMAIGSIFEMVREANKAMDNKEYSENNLKQIFEFIELIMGNVLGIELSLENKVDNAISSDLVDFLLEIRAEAKKEKNFVMSDRIRDRLQKIGIKIKDGREQTTWTM